jgi:hypothetical protein
MPLALWPLDDGFAVRQVECAVFRDLGAPLVAYAVVPRRYLLFVRRGLRCRSARCRVGVWRPYRTTLEPADA